MVAFVVGTTTQAKYSFSARLSYPTETQVKSVQVFPDAQCNWATINLNNFSKGGANFNSKIRYLLDGDQWKGKPLGGAEPARAPTGMASVLNSL